MQPYRKRLTGDDTDWSYLEQIKANRSESKRIEDDWNGTEQMKAD